MGTPGAYISLRRLTQSSIPFKERYHSVIAPPPIPTLIRADSRHNSVYSYGGGDNLTGGGARVKWERADDYDYDLAATDDETPPGSESFLQRIVKYLKILVPHVGLNILLLSYITLGALIFIFLEAEEELRQRRSKLQQILNIYQLIIEETSAICRSGAVAETGSPNSINGTTVGHNSHSSQPRHFSSGSVQVLQIERRIRPLLSVLSRTHEYDDRFTREAQMWSDSEVEEMETKWTFAASSLYALTVITSTGYDHLTPSTDAGRIFTVFYGLLGIPLMFITAADIGKFLSDLVIRFYGRLLSLITWIASVLDAIKDYLIDTDSDSLDSRKLREKRRRRRRMNLDDDDGDEEERLQLPIVSYFALVVGYCAIGSMLFNSWEKGAVWSFVHGLFFSFNTITTIGLGNICVRSRLYLALTVFYVIIGLAVITASLDLCSSTLKRTFTKLHYFGRKIRGARGRFQNVSDDIREAMKIVAALKKTRPSKERITLEDLKRFLEVQEQLLRQPYVPINVHIFKWIEDAYYQYFADEASLPTKSTNPNSSNRALAAEDALAHVSPPCY